MISIVVPVYNEEESLPFFYKELASRLAYLKPYEIIFVDDGSTDKSLEYLKKILAVDKTIRLFSFRKNQGKSEALMLGFQKARGGKIITLDADLQDKPDQIKNLIKKSEEGYDLVCGWRKNRKDSLKHVFASKLFNFIARTFWGLHLHDYNCGLKVYTKEAAQSISIYGSLHRFIPLLVFEKGFSVTELAIVHEKRKYGKSKYTISKLWKDLPDLFTMIFLSRYGTRPLHFFGTFGGGLFLVGSSILLYLAIIHSQGEAIVTRPLLFFGMILVLGGIQIFFTGFLADLLINISQTKGKTFSLKYESEG